jgi:hypothetical protein
VPFGLPRSLRCTIRPACRRAAWLPRWPSSLGAARRGGSGLPCDMKRPSPVSRLPRRARQLPLGISQATIAPEIPPQPRMGPRAPGDTGPPGDRQGNRCCDGNVSPFRSRGNRRKSDSAVRRQHPAPSASVLRNHLPASRDLPARLDSGTRIGCERWGGIEAGEVPKHAVGVARAPRKAGQPCGAGLGAREGSVSQAGTFRTNDLASS